MQLQSNVRVQGIKPEILLAMVIINTVFEKREMEMVVTSVVDGNHDGGEFATSSHYAGMSFDCVWPGGPILEGVDTLQQKIMAEIKELLGSQYFVTVNTPRTQLHVSFMPTR